jgi:hypothetical protein
MKSPWARREIGGEGGEGGGEEGKGRKKKPNSDAAADELSASLGQRLDASRRKWASRVRDRSRLCLIVFCMFERCLLEI